MDSIEEARTKALKALVSGVGTESTEARAARITESSAAIALFQADLDADPAHRAFLIALRGRSQ